MTIMETSTAYEMWRAIAAGSGLLFFVLLFVLATAYALWPSNRDTFEHAARSPLRED
jgi:cytochrome c oxidase cbb3-type subunit 4